MTTGFWARAVVRLQKIAIAGSKLILFISESRLTPGITRPHTTTGSIQSCE
jgi:hypothetical protein